MEKSNLAIVIPAYKSTFLAETLDSIARQTCLDFTLYVGDDCSPNNLENIVDKYRDKIDLVYKRFEKNLGKRDLVAQWERCVDMTQGEKWLWLFSDDDVMSENCVEEFYRIQSIQPEAQLIHFNIGCIESSTGEIVQLPRFPKFLSGKEYLDKKIKGHLISYVVEFFVRSDIFFNNGRFQNFDLAWGSDFISWVKFADAAFGIYTCENAKVLWRKSDENISPNKSNTILVRKIQALIENAQWIDDFTKRRVYKHKWFYTKYPLGEIKRNRHLLSSEQKNLLLKQYCKKIQPSIVVMSIICLFRVLYWVASLKFVNNDGL